MLDDEPEVCAVNGAVRHEALERLDVLVGEWEVEAEFPGQPAVAARSVFEWTLDGSFLVQRTEVPLPEAPDSMAIVAADPETGAYTQHYFDTRGVARLYAMTFADGVWRLVREAPDFSPLAFRQRFTGRLGADGDTIQGAWEQSRDSAAGWEHDFTLTYRRNR
ncbi:hypothetical protein AB0B60_40285 [Streptomyces lincolnensis]|uniref:hypothetical protein n=1 Tax=Streptomyces lincolnensis TaxID=1915 RepID=UPI001B800401|nr:hypothetical protein [Streptomyces lincolnensis]